jgi:hypothetical protein
VIVVIARASSTPEVGGQAHLPDPGITALVSGPTVVRTVCGVSIIAQTFDRDGATCALCLAVSGQHPGGHGKRYLTRWHRAQHPLTRAPINPHHAHAEGHR